MADTEFPSDADSPRRRPARRVGLRYSLALALFVGGLVLALGISAGGAKTRSDQAVNFPRVAVPGVFTLHVEHPATYYVYAEGTACLDSPNCHGQLYPVAVKVTSPTGNAVKVQPTHGPSYMVGGTEGNGVAKFDAATTGNYRVAASTGPYSEGSVAVGKAFPAWTQDWIPVLAMVLLWAAGILIIVLSIIRHARQTRSAPS